ncbi:tmRNA-binding protein SmpB [Staphylococcus gallinarum]|uniref:TmRNA-binding protein SmpB n=1 Tax=Staphylococcus gallinarum TaxID=1293 RepID=A0A380FFE2_STAGA|nr:tmRNA-binding protein SmpB [Staphylococcus gallinarum]
MVIPKHKTFPTKTRKLKEKHVKRKNKSTKEVKTQCQRKKSPGTLAENRKARHDYIIEDTIEAGIVFTRDRD